MDKDYLDPSFDPSSLKVAQLRGILLDNDVSYPSNAKKKELVRLFKDNVAGKSPIVEVSVGSEDETDIESEREASGLAVKSIAGFSETQDEGLKTPEKPAKKSEKKTSEKRKEDKKDKESKTVKDSKEKDKSSKDKKPKKSKAKSEADSEVKDDPSIEIAESQAVKETPQSDTSKSSVKQKRKFAETKESPSKGNVFMVDSDSDIDVSSPMQKKRKAVFNESIDASPIIPRLSAPRTATPEKKPKVASSPKGPANTSLKSVTSLKSPVSDAQTPRKSHFSGSEDVTDGSELNSTFVQKARAPAILPANVSKIDTPTLTRIEDSGYSTEVESAAESPSNSKESLSQSLQLLRNDLSDDSHSFDNALAKLKKERTPSSKGSSPKDVELAKLLGVDINGVKPKPKGKRNVTPRRQIVIPESRLNYKTELSSSGLSSDDASSDEEEVDLAVFGSDASEILSEVDSEEDSEAETSDSYEEKKSKLPTVLRALSYFFLWTILVGGSLFTYWYREQTLLVGYCGQEIYQRTVPATPDTADVLVQFGDYLDDNFKPTCVDCPQHARCFPRLELACYDDFVVRSPWYFPYVPFLNPRAQRCVPDTKKAEKIEIIMGVALELLRARNANRNCGQSAPEDLSAGISYTELHDLLLQLKAPYITVEEFEELWERSVEELQKEPEIIVGHSDNHIATGLDANNTVGQTGDQNKIFRSTSLSHISVKCIMSNTLLAVAVKFKRALVILAVLIVGALFANYKYQEQKLYTRRIDTLYLEVLRKLQRQAKLARASNELPEYIGSIQLRDLILSSESNLSRKMRFWEAVSRKVDRNTNVKHELLEIHGEVMKVWRWISSLEDEIA